ncbi:AAA family ATPase [Actinoplanes missouriensis]|uniref:AAA family ATPase n=1 Tax=Actinoplanes missouriensis TaxID=1866 RepID=UPI0033DCFFCF
MYVKQIRLENVRGFHGARTVSLDLTRPDGSLAGWTVLAGRNGSGKTSLLRAVALAIGGPNVARSLSPDFAGWISMGAKVGTVDLSLTRDPGGRRIPGRPSDCGSGLEPLSRGRRAHRGRDLADRSAPEGSGGPAGRTGAQEPRARCPR